MIKRIITGIIVGTALMFVNRSMPKAYNLTKSNIPQVSVSPNTENYTMSNNNDIVVGGETVAQLLNVSNILDVNNNTLNGYTILSPVSNDYPLDNFPVIAQNDSSPTKFLIGAYLNPIPQYSEQTYEMLEIDTNTMPFQVKNILILCNPTAPNVCLAFFSKGDLPTFSQTVNITNNRFTLNSDTMIFALYSERKTQYLDTRYIYSATLGYEGDIFQSNYVYHTFKQFNNQYQWSEKFYMSTQNIPYENGTIQANYSDIQFYVNWSIIDSAHEDNSEYGSDKKVTSYSVAFEPTPWDLSEYNYYYIFTTDYNDLPPLSEWGQMTESDKGIGVLANLKEDGYVYLRITDKNNNVVHNDLFTTGNQIGKTIIFPNNNMNNQNFFNTLINDLDYGGPISSIMLIPPRFINGIYTSFGGTCSPINLSLMNKNITFNCISLNSFLGNNLVNTLDIIFSAFVGFGIFKFLYDKYDRFTNLENIDTFYNNAPKGGY